MITEIKQSMENFKKESISNRNFSYLNIFNQCVHVNVEGDKPIYPRRKILPAIQKFKVKKRNMDSILLSQSEIDCKEKKISSNNLNDKEVQTNLGTITKNSQFKNVFIL